MSTHRLRLVGWNVKSPSLSLTGQHKWLSRRTALRQRIGGFHGDVAALIETGSGGYLTWWKAVLRRYKLRWAPHGAKWQNIFLGPRAHYVTGGLYSLPREWTLNGDNKEMTWAVFELDGLRWITGTGHPENQQGKDRKTGHSAGFIRQMQVLHHLEYLDSQAEKHGVPVERRTYFADTNAPKGDVLALVSKKTRYRDAFALAKTVRNDHVCSNNKWMAPRHTVKGSDERIDLWLVDETCHVEFASNVVTTSKRGPLSDHNPQVVDLHYVVAD